MHKRVRFLLLTFSLCLSLTVTGCGLQDLLGNKKKSASKNGGQEQKPVIAVALNQDDPNRVLILRGIEDMAQKANTQIKDVSTKNNQKAGDKNQQGSDQQGTDQQKSPLEGAKVLIYQGGNPDLLQTAQEKKIPVVALGNLAGGAKPVGAVIPDPEKTGEMMAQTLTSKLSEGQVVILQGDPNDSSSQEILAGNKLILGRYPKIVTTVISSPSGSESVAKQSFTEFLTKNGGKIQGVLAHTEKLAAQASEVLKQNQLDKKVVLVGGQANIQSLQRMAAGSQQADIDTNPYLQGVNAYQWAQKVVNKESFDVNDSIAGDQGEIPAKIVPVKPVTPENLAVVQKSYVKAMTQPEEKKSDQGGANPGKGQTSGSSGSSGEKGQGDQNKQGNTGGQNQGSPPAGVPAGVNKITERVRTETTREYLDSQGKVIGTEKSANEQVRTIPPEMLKQEEKQKTDQKTDQKTGGKSDQKDQQSGQ